MSTKINLIKLLFIGLLLKFFINTTYAGSCDNQGIIDIFSSIEKSENSGYNPAIFNSGLSEEIEKQKNIYKGKNLEEIEIVFKNRQNERYKLAIEHIANNIKNIGYEFNSSKIEELSKKDFFISNKKDEIIKSKQKIIPASLLFKSSNLDSIIYSCLITKNNLNINYITGKETNFVINEIQGNINKSEDLIIKQKEANKEAVLKYSSFIENYKIHKRLESVITYLEKLRTRFRDLAHLVSIMPAKLVNFGFKK